MLPTTTQNDYSEPKIVPEPVANPPIAAPMTAAEQWPAPGSELAPSREVWNLPNSLTLLRIFLVPFLVVVLLTKFEGREYAALAIFLVAAITDLLDGYFARRFKKVTRLGILLDPIADKLLISAALISMVEIGLAPAWMVVIIIGREFAVSGLRSIAAQNGVLIPASPLGKGKTVSQVIAIALLILGYELGEFMFVGVVALWVVVILALASGVDYFLKFYRAILGTGRS